MQSKDLTKETFSWHMQEDNFFSENTSKWDWNLGGNSKMLRSWESYRAAPTR